jgi:hypothetical protein
LEHEGNSIFWYSIVYFKEEHSGLPTVLRSSGYRFFFFSNEGFEPAHVHVEQGGKYAKFGLGPVVLLRSVGFGSSELNRLRKMVEDHATFFKEKWDEHFGGKERA